jgi:hypothetical protein
MARVTSTLNRVGLIELDVVVAVARHAMFARQPPSWGCRNPRSAMSELLKVVFRAAS